MAFVPKSKPHAHQALDKRQASDPGELGEIAQDLRQAIIRNAAVEVMHMVHTDVGGDPAQNAGQFVVRAAKERSVVRFPSMILSPDRIFELMLHVEQPNADRRSKKGDRKLYDQEGADAKKVDHDAGDESDGGIRSHGADPKPPIGIGKPKRQAVAEQEVVSRPNHEHDEGMAIETISKATQPRQRPILPNRQHVDVADPTLIEVA